MLLSASQLTAVRRKAVRRWFALVSLTIALVCAANACLAQGVADRVHRVGIITLVSPIIAEPWIKGFHEEFRRLGYEQGRNYVFESRFANGERERLKELVVELVGAKVDVFLTAGEPVLIAAKQHGGNVPIVTVSCDPLERLLGSLSRPGGNATGFTCISSDLGSKRMGLIRTLLPNSERIAVLYSETDTLKTELQQLASQADQLGLRLAQFPVQSPEDFGPAFKRMVDQKSDALYIVPSSFANFHRRKLAELAIANGLPAMYGFGEFVHDGGLISYGAPIRDGFRRAAHQIDKVLKGISPADIPVEQPTHFELLLNMKTARALRLEVPSSLLVQADELVE